MSDFALVGDEFDVFKPPPIFELRLEDHIPDIDPEKFGYARDKVPWIRPSYYFITSGEAIAKARKLESDLWALAHKLKSNRPKKAHKKYKNYEAAVWGSAVKARLLVKKLLSVKQSNCFLETEWRDGSLLLIPKNPRGMK
jgi:hypothetical protein